MNFNDILERLVPKAPKVRGSKYSPHQSERERARRARQVLEDKLEMAGARDLRDFEYMVAIMDGGT